jgi:type I restriction enzyme S subunit
LGGVMAAGVALEEIVQDLPEPHGPWLLPNGWEWKPLRSLSSFIGRGRGPTYVESGGVPVVNQRCIRWHRLEAQHFKQTTREAFERLAPELHLKAGDLLWNSTGTGTIGRALIYDGSVPEITFDSHVTLVRPTSIVAGFLGYFIETMRVQGLVVDGHVGSTNQRELPRSFVENLLVPFAPLAEQRRIVARVDELFSEIAEGEAALAEARKGLETFRRALLKAAVTGELTKNWRAANAIPETGLDILNRLRKHHPNASPTRPGWKPKSELPILPKNWTWCAIAEAGEVQLGRQRAPQHHDGGNMRPYLRVANVLEDRLDLSDVKWMNFTPAEFETFALRPGDILLNEGQAPDLLGRPAMYQGEIVECCFQKTLLRFRAKDGVLPDYALIVFRHYMRSGRFKRESRITTNIGHLTQVRFVVMEFPLPPEAEQRAILDLFRENEAAATDVLALLDAEAADAARLKQSILKAAFEGRLVLQDPADQSASVPLTRIKEQNSNRFAAKPSKPERRGRSEKMKR